MFFMLAIDNSQYLLTFVFINAWLLLINPQSLLFHDYQQAAMVAPHGKKYIEMKFC